MATAFFSMSSFAASSLACMTPAAFVAASRSSLAALRLLLEFDHAVLVLVAFFGSRV